MSIYSRIKIILNNNDNDNKKIKKRKKKCQSYTSMTYKTENRSLGKVGGLSKPTCKI